MPRGAFAVGGLEQDAFVAFGAGVAGLSRERSAKGRQAKENQRRKSPVQLHAEYQTT